ncbi:MAG: hypothetical protein RL846_05710 [Deltaproteobacteria bacterium]
MNDLDQRIDRALEDGETERAAELLAAQRALAEDVTPNLAFEDFAGQLPIERRRAWWWPAAGLLAAAAAAFLLVPRGDGVKGPGDACTPVELRVAHEGTQLALHPTVDDRCSFTVHAFELDAARWRPVGAGEADALQLGPGRWVLVVFASRDAIEPERADVVGVLNAVGRGAPPTIRGEPVFADVYDLGSR